jgi:CRISPR-associated protein Cmr4
MSNGGSNEKTKGNELCLLSFLAETSLHPGTGQSTEAIDLPVERERHTGIPVLPAPSLKGSFREAAEKLWGKDANEVDVLFGPEDPENHQLHGGAVSFSEARLFAFPVRSLAEVFVWTICPLVIDRLRRDMSLAGMNNISIPVLKPAAASAFVPKGSALSSIPVLALEDLSFSLKPDEKLDVLARNLANMLFPGDALYSESKDRFSKLVMIIPDGDFFYLVRHATQIAARIKLTSGKTTSEFFNAEGQKEKGNLWYEETLPRDCLFYSIVRTEAPKTSQGDKLKTAQDVSTYFKELVNKSAYLRVGGDETVGRGWCRLTAVSGASKQVV